MLIESHRHTTEDVSYWEELESADLQHGVTLVSGNRIVNATSSIVQFSAKGQCYVGTSWGKDSVIVAHLLACTHLKIPLVHIVQEGPQKDPDQQIVRDRFLREFDCDYHEIVTEPTEKRQRETDSRTGHSPQLDQGIRIAQKRFGKRWIGGLRADESSVRALRSQIGPTNNSCWPIRHWSAQDVFGYLAVLQLPVHPAYAMTGGGRWDRNQIRVSILFGEKGTQFGRREWEREYYGDILNRMEADCAKAR